MRNNPSEEEPLSPGAAKSKRERAELNAQIEAYLHGGGSIKQCTAGPDQHIVGDTPAEKKKKDRCRKRGLKKMTSKNENPFKASVFKGRQTYYSTGPERLQMVKGFNLEQCKAALQVEGIQKTVEKALNSRIKKLAV